MAASDSYDPTAAGAGTLPARWARHFRTQPDAPCASLYGGGALRYGDLEAASARAAGRLARAGLRSGDRLLISAEASLDLVVAHVAALRSGLTVVPANTAYGPDELAHLIRDARPKVALFDAGERADWARAADPAIEVWTPALALPDGDTPALDAVDPAAAGLIGYTSGTTGRPKGAVLSHANLLAGLEALRVAWGWTRSDHLLLCLPLFHMHGLGVGLYGTLHAGAALTSLPRFDPDTVLAIAKDGDATLFFGVPTLYHRLVSHPEVAALGRLRLCVSGSAPLAAELHDRFAAATGQRILERYGMSETLMLASNPLDGERRPGSVGFPLPGVSLRLSEGAAVEVRGPSVFAGYWERPEANADAFTGDGWFRTGDLGRFDPEGYLVLDGRAKELIISGGYNVYPREVEEALRTHPEVDDAAVVGTASPEWGEEVTAYIVSASPPSLKALRAHVAPLLAGYKQPRRVHVVAALPRNALGKLQKHRLRDGQVIPEAP
ncbi:MAG: AMP-binding protein [Myxococcota bacterium]